MPNSLKSRLKKLAHQGLLSEKDLSRIYTNNDVAEELEKIKENIQFIAEKCLPNNLAEEFEVKGLKTSIEIIDRRISELKGENK